MMCDVCGKETRVIDSRFIENDKMPYIRRRRQCVDDKCHNRFTTLEVHQEWTTMLSTDKRRQKLQENLQQRIADLNSALDMLQ